jgi:hypothetical protein
VTWTSTNSAVATITVSGLATGVSAGSTTIQAASGSITTSTGLTVTAISGLVGNWTFDEGMGTTAADSSGNAHTATLVNGVTWITGKIGGAISANGVNQYVSIPAIDLSTTNAVTVSLWANRTYSTAGGHALFEDSSNFNSSSTGFGLFPDDSSCRSIMAGVHGDAGYSINCYSQPSSGAWHHLAVVYDKSQAGNSEVTLYIDGLLQAPTQNLYTANNTNNFGSNPLYLFSRSGTQEFNAGLIDDLRLYNRALSASEIQQVYQSGNAVLVSLAVTPANSSIAKGTTQQFTATGTYSNGSTQNLTSSVTWTSTNTAVATITSAGLGAGVATGNTTIQATSGTITGSTGLTVTPPTLVSLAVTPANTSITKDTTQQFTATGTYSDGSTQNLTSSVIWSSTNTAVATITTAGLATGVATGNTTIQAASGTITGSTGLTVTTTLVAIAVTPANASIAKGATQQFTATGTYSDGSTQNLTNSALWASTNPSVATINSTGRATGAGVGSTTIQATSGSITGSTGLTVTAPVLVSLAVTPPNPSIFNGGTQQFTATGTYSDGSTQNLTSSVTWTSTNTPVATITSSGLATGLATGTTTIQATSGSISGSTGLAVLAPVVLVSLAVTPANASIAKGAAQQFTATGTYSDGSTQNLTNSVTWTSTNSAVATITVSGLATGVSAGSTTIQAASGSITNSTGLTVTAQPKSPTNCVAVDNGAALVTTTHQTCLMTAGETFIVTLEGVGFDSVTGLTISDTQGNTFWQVGGDFNGNGGFIHCSNGPCLGSWFIPNVKSTGTDTITVRWTGSVQFVAQFGAHIFGMQVIDPWDGSGSAFGTGSGTANSGPASGHSDSLTDIVYSICSAYPNALSPGSGFTTLDTSLGNTITQWKTGAGNSNSTCTWSGSATWWIAETITLRPAGTYNSISRRQAESVGITNGRQCVMPIVSTPGGTLLYAQGQVNGGYITVGLTDSGGHTWTNLINLNQGACFSAGYTAACAAGYLANAPAGITSVTMTIDSVNDNGSCSVAEYANVATSSPVDKASSATATSSSTWSSNTITTTNANDLLVGFAVSNSFTASNLSLSGSWKLATIGSGVGGQSMIGDQIVSSTGTYNFTGTQAGANSSTEIAVFAFK